MYSKDSLLEMAAAADKEYLELLELYPPGICHYGRNNARRVMEEALACACWMEKNGLNEVANVGPFVSSTYSKMQKVRLKKGSVIFGTHPSIGKDGIVTTRAQTVILFSGNKGYVGYDGEIAQGKVEWVGTGGYWKWTDINNVE
jgi:hypothetical protein